MANVGFAAKRFAIISGLRQRVFLSGTILPQTLHLSSLGISQETALRRLHVTDDQGQLHQGADAFITIWRHLRGWYWLSLLGRMPIIRPLARFGYNRFADYRFRKLPHCQIYLTD